MAELPLGDLLKCALQVIGRIAMRPEQVGEILVVKASAKQRAKQLKAYNLCDGTKTLGQVAKAAGLDQGNFSRTAARWVKSGVLFRLQSVKEVTPLHLYPLVEREFRLTRKRKAAGKRKRARKRQGR